MFGVTPAQLEEETKHVKAQVSSLLDTLASNHLNISCLDLGVLYPVSLSGHLMEIDDMLMKNTTIQTLAFCGVLHFSKGDITANYTGEFCAKPEGFMQCLSTNTTLHTLNLERCSLDDWCLR